MGPRLLVDGGVTATLDIATAVEHGATEVLAIDPALPLPASFPGHILGVLTRSLDVLMRQQLERELHCYQGQATITVLQPGLAVPPGFDVPRRTRDLIALGETIGAELVPRAFDRKGRLVPGILRAR